MDERIIAREPATGRRTWSLVLGVAVIGVAFIAAIIVVAASESRQDCSVRESASLRSVVSTLGTAEAVAVVEAARSIGTIRGSENWTPVPGWELTVTDVLYVAAQSREMMDENWDLPLTPVPTPAGAIEVLGGCGVDLDAAIVEGGQLIVFLSAPDPAIYTDLEVPWKMITAARETPEGLVFVDSDSVHLTDGWDRYLSLIHI